jgi:transposase
MTTVSVLAGPERRRRWTTAEKLRIVEESLNAGVSVVEFARRRDLHPNLVHTWRWQARKGILSENPNGEARFAPVAVVSAVNSVQPISSETSVAGIIELVLRNGRIMRVPEHLAPAQAARFADALEGSGR